MKFLTILICLSLSLSVWSKDIKFYHEASNILDLSESVYDRHGVVVKQVDSIDINHSFSTFIQVRTDATLLGEKALITNKKTLKPQDCGFLIGTQENGSWMVSFWDGKHDPWEYKPTVERQPINDGKWHCIGLTHDAEKQEMRMYYDGKNVAIYCTNGNTNLATGNPLRLGCINDSQWYSFNGSMKNFHFIDKVLDEETIKSECGESCTFPQKEVLAQSISNIKIMAFNIYHGGHELGNEVGVNRVIEVIKNSGADVIGMIETYGSGAIIADALGYYFYLRSSNLSIMSKYPIKETYNLFNSFNCSGASLQVSHTQTINYINLWLDYRPITNEQLNNHEKIENIIAGEWELRAKQLQTIVGNMKPLLQQNTTPLIVSGDFNSDSHLDWGENTKNWNGHKGYIIEWPTSKLMLNAGFKDSYRVLHPDVIKYPCLTWSTMAKNELQYRIDFIYFKGKKMKAISSEMIDKHRVRFPSDHAALMTTFKIK